MMSTWMTAFSLCLIILAVLPTINACAQTREIQTANCFCDEHVDYSKITCPLPNNKIYNIIMSKDYKYEIDCKGENIKNMDLIPTLFPTDRTIEYFGYKDCPIENFKQITDKLFSFSRKFRSLEFKNMKTFHGHAFEGFQIDLLSIENSPLLNELPEDLLEHMPIVTRIFINGNTNLTTIPEKFFTFAKNVQSIDLGFNNLKYLPGKLFANLSKLTHLQLFANQLKSIEEELFEDLHALELLELMTNQIEVLPKTVFKNLKQLKRISLRKNRFKTLPEDLFLYNVQLQQIQFADNPFLSELPDKLFANLSQLNESFLQSCNLSSIPDNIFSGATNLKILNLSNNKLKHLSKYIFSPLENLNTLSLERNNLETLEDNIFENNRQLKILNLGYNKIKVNDFTFNGLRNLVSLNLEHNSLSDLTVRSFSHFRYLETLDMSNNKLTLKIKDTYGFTEFSILPQLENLKKLNLENNLITSIFPDWNYSMLKLEELNLANNTITELNYNDLQFIQHQAVTVNLEYNLISTINLSSAEILLGENKKFNKAKRIIQLEGNPILCDCRIYDFIRYLDKIMDPIVYEILVIKTGDGLICQSPEKYKGQKLKEINSRYLTCTLHDGPIPPKSCSMEHYEYQMFEKRLIVNCSNNGLTKIPKILFNRSDIDFHGREIKVYLSGNKITSMPGPNMGYENVVELDLSHNFINEITWVPPNIQILKLDHNNLTFINNKALAMINQTITNVTFHNNPWICNCDAINFTKYLQENFQKIPKLHDILCYNSDKRQELTRLTPEDLCPYSTLMIIVICVIIASLAILTSILIALYYRHKTQIKVWLYARNMCLYLITEEEVDQDKPYDAFISFSHEDEEFVVNELLPGLETGPHPFKLCVHFRDWQPGEFITKNIANSIEASRRTVVVVSKGFLTSEWGKMEFRTAHTEALKEGRARVIMIVYGDLGPTDDLDPEIKAYLSTNTYVKWGSPWFWDNLRYALPHSSKYAKMSEVITNQPSEKITQFHRQFNDKMDLIRGPTTPPAATTPPADSMHRLHDPLLTTSALNVALINGNLINNPDKTKTNNNIYMVV